MLQDKSRFFFWGIVLLAVVSFFFPELAEAATTGNSGTGTSGGTSSGNVSSGDPWHQLGDTAQAIGWGLRKAGYIIAGLGLITVSFMAIFNKISWKSLWYIFLSCFTLTAMTVVINLMYNGEDKSYETWAGSGGSSGEGFGGDVELPGDADEVTVNKSGG